MSLRQKSTLASSFGGCAGYERWLTAGSRSSAPSAEDVFLEIEADGHAVDGTFHYPLGWVMAGGSGPLHRDPWANQQVQTRRTRYQQARRATQTQRRGSINRTSVPMMR